MSKLFKVLLWVIGSLALLIVIAMVCLVTLVNPNRFKSQITAQIEKNTGRQATIDNIGWSFFPWVKLQVNDLTLSNPAGFPATPFIAVGDANISVDLIALLKQQLIINSLAIENVQIDLIRTANGNNNWTIKKPATSPVKTSATKTTTTSNNKLNGFHINAIDMSKVNIHWQDAKAKQDITFNVQDFNTQQINFDGNPFTVNSQFLYQATPAATPVTINLSSKITVNNASKKINIDDLKLALNKFSVTGNAELSQMPAPTLTAALSIPNGNLAALLTQLGCPLTFQNKTALTNVAGNFTLVATPHSAKINNLSVMIDDAKLTGQANLTQLKPLQGNYALNIDKLNLDQYQTVSEPNVKTNTVNNDTPAVVTLTTNAGLPSTIRQANISGKITIGNLQVNNLQLQQVNVPLVIKGGAINAAPVTANLYQGTLQANLAANYNSTAPIYSLNSTLNNIDMHALLSQMANFNKLSGTGQVILNVTTTGNNKTAILQALNGHGSINLQNGNYTGLNIIGALNSAANLFFKQPPADTTSSTQTSFTAMQASFNIFNGNLKNEDLDLNSPLMKVTGNGSINLVTQQIDYHLLVTPTTNAIPQLANLQKAIGDTIPLQVTGSLNSPVIIPDMSKISLQATKQTISKNLDSIDKSLDKAGKGISNTLNKMFGN